MRQKRLVTVSMPILWASVKNIVISADTTTNSTLFINTISETIKPLRLHLCLVNH